MTKMPTNFQCFVIYVLRGWYAFDRKAFLVHFLFSNKMFDVPFPFGRCKHTLRKQFNGCLLSNFALAIVCQVNSTYLWFSKEGLPITKVTVRAISQLLHHNKYSLNPIYIH